MVMAPEPPTPPKEPPPPAPGVRRHVIRVLTHEGDTLVEWNPDVPAEVDVAQKKFDVLMEIQGYRMFVATAPSAKPDQIRGFTNDVAEILALPAWKGG